MAAAAAAIEGAAMGTVAGILLSKVLRVLEYCTNLNQNMNSLKKGVEKLDKRKADVELRRRNIGCGKIVKKEVEHWLSCVKIINEEVQVVENLCSAISRGCPLKAWLGKTVLRLIAEVEKLHQEGNFSGDIVIDVKKNIKKLEIMGILMPAVSRKLKYCRNLEKNMNTLREGVAELNQLKDDIVELRKRKIKRGKIIKEEVEHWLSCVNIINERLKDVEKSCSAGSRGFLAKASLGETVIREIDEVEKLIREHGSFSGANEKPKHALERLNSQKEKVERQKSSHENAGEVVREEVNDWLIDVRSIKAVFQILKGASRRVSLCNKHKFNEIVLKKSNAVNILRQRGTFPDGIVIG